ncbi:glycoside hydrolase family 18 protein [Pedobacter sp. Du54]|uniref:glycoside hydrolase family 18 protein n=1 Tax=Pedobacter anseongensis TaxID=3133439 RepID=UPI0030AEA591
MKTKQLLTIFGIAIVLLSACKKGDDPTPTPPVTPPVVVPPTFTIPTPPTRTPWVAGTFKIVAYMPGYRDPASVVDAKYKMITHLFFAFLNINPTADGSVLPLTATETSRFNLLKQKSKDNNVKFGISVMGAESVFAAIAKNSTTRANFVTNLVSFAKTNNLDGLDIDWEYPRTLNGGPNTEYTALMRELSIELHKSNITLSAAITPAVYVSTNKDAIEPAVYEYVDFFNIMQYDGAGYDSAEPLNHASLKMTDASLNVWLTTKGMPKEKAILGMPLYGKSGGSPVKSLGYRDIEASGANPYLNVATVNGLAYGYNGIELTWIKAQRAKDRCNGIMFWEFSHDSNNANSLIKAANDQLGRPY